MKARTQLIVAWSCMSDSVLVLDRIVALCVYCQITIESPKDDNKKVVDNLIRFI